MKRHRADVVVGVLVGAVLLGGGAISWQAYQRRRALDQSMDSMMDSSVGAMHGTDPLWYVLGTVLLAAVLGGGYLLARDVITAPNTGQPSAERPGSGEPQGIESTEAHPHSTEPINPEAQPQARVLDLLPDDERRVLEPVITSPGITQIELRDRSAFSKSKVSQTVSELEKRGLLYRERQGRTYRIYPSDALQHQQAGS